MKKKFLLQTIEYLCPRDYLGLLFIIIYICVCLFYLFLNKKLLGDFRWRSPWGRQMNGSLLSSGGTIFLLFYLFSLIGIGLIGRFARKDNSMADFYLAGRGMGFFVLFLTLYATQYSGNTLIGFAGKAYRNGFTSLVCCIFCSMKYWKFRESVSFSKRKANIQSPISVF